MIKKVYIKSDALTLCNLDGIADARLSAIPYKPTYGRLVELTDLAQVWHDADERPDFDFDQILVSEEYGSLFAYDNDDVFGISDPGGVYADNSWQEFVVNYGVERWAYVTDLLPREGAKGGAE